MRRRLVKTALCIVLPFVLAYAFASTLAREIGRAFRYAWLDAKIEITSFHRYMRRANEL